MKNLLIFSVLIIFNSFLSFSQKWADDDLYKTLKLHVLMDQMPGALNFDALSKLRVISLKSKGFRDTKFYGVHYNVFENVETDKTNTKLINCYYVFAHNFSQNKIYNLKGFKENDFKEFYYYEVSNFEKKKNRYNGKLRYLDDFLTDFYVEDLDLKCLYLSTFYARKKRKTNECIISCVERDSKIH